MIINKQNIRCQWESLVRIAGFKDMSRSVNIDLGRGVRDLSAEMSDDDMLAIQVIMKMYSLESFLYREVNRACREKDKSKIQTLGPFSFLVTKIL